MKGCAIIVAGGKGKRFSEEKDSYKQFLSLKDKPVIVWAISAFENVAQVRDIIVVVPDEKIGYCRNLMKQYKFRKITGIVSGGRFRQDSVYNGLRKVSRDIDIVLVHDSVRPLITPSLIEGCISEALKYGAAILAVPVKDTIKLAKKNIVSQTLDRSRLWSVQTPQCFRREIILKAYEKARKDNFLGSDDAALVERLSQEVRIVQGSYENIKITTPEDIILAEEILKRRSL